MATVDLVQTRQQWRAFHQVPWQVHRTDPCWIPTPGPAERRVLDVRRNPFFQHARVSCWTVRRGREVCGRIAAIIDENHNRFHREEAGFFGFFDVVEDDQAAAALLGTARDWLAQQGMKVFRGPASPSLNYEAGLLVDGFGSSPTVLMAYNPPYYPVYCERFGLVKARDLYAYLLDCTHPMPDLVRRIADRARRSGLTIRPLDFGKLHEEIAKCRAIFEDAWSRNWGFVPMTDQEWTAMAEEFQPLLQPELVLIAEMSGKPAGLALTIPDINPVLRELRTWHWPLAYLKLGLHLWKTRILRVALLGVVPGQQSLGIGAALYDELYQRGRPLGYDTAEISWVLEDNALAIRSAEAVGARRYKTYRLYEMPIGVR